VCLAIPGRVIEVVDEDNRLAEVEVAGVRRTVNIGLLDADGGGGVGPDDWVLIHVGFAMSKIDEEEARLALEGLQLLGRELTDELDALATSRITTEAPAVDDEVA
jgi:hydrogenase expression/formation protein HypC